MDGKGKMIVVGYAFGRPIGMYENDNEGVFYYIKVKPCTDKPEKVTSPAPVISSG